VRFLSLEEVLFIHQDQIANYGGSPEIRDEGLLESAITQPMTTFGGQELHPSVFDKAAAYLFHICSNHPFVDGNKRTALASALVFLELNNITIEDPEDSLYDIVIRIATGNSSKEMLSIALRHLAEK
jgi:death-on-curing protein